MSVPPSPSSSRGEIVLQPAHFTASPFVHAARADIDRLVEVYSQRYTRATTRPFALFKEIWQTEGWPWIQLAVLDARSRAALLSVVVRLFSEHIDSGEPPLKRAAALFGLYTVLYTQPSTSAPPLYSVARVQVSCDRYREMLVLPDALDGEHLRPVRPHVVYVQSRLLEARVFEILPRAEMHALSPRGLPREVVVGAGGTEGLRRQRGRPSRRARAGRARDALAALDGRCGDGTVAAAGAGGGEWLGGEGRSGE